MGGDGVAVMGWRGGGEGRIDESGLGVVEEEEEGEEAGVMVEGGWIV